MTYRMNANRYIAALLICCFSAFLGHSLVPHHHHSGVFHTPIATDCPFEHGDHHEHEHDGVTEPDAEKHPTHCHAFNDVVFEKYTAPSIRPGTLSMLAMMVPVQSALPDETQHRCSYTFVVLKPPYLPAVYLGSRDLRAPPVFA